MAILNSPKCLCMVIIQFLFFTYSHSWAPLPVSTGKILVTGSTGRVGRLVVQELLSRPNSTVVVRALVRDVKKAAEVLPPSSSRLEIVQCDMRNMNDLKVNCRDCDAVVWAATGFSDTMSWFDKVIGLFTLKMTPTKFLDVAALDIIGKEMISKRGIIPGGPAVVVCSSAGVTRPTWSSEMKANFEGAADIPIVRLNPFDILGVKRNAEDALRSTKAPYCIVRPCGLNDKWPQGRPIISQGDLAVGRINRNDVATFLVNILHERDAVGRTIECISLPGLPVPRSYSPQLSRTKLDSAGPLTMGELAVQYGLLQQLVPGESLAPNALAMGQTYEQLDRGEKGRLGERGAEVAPIAPSA